MSESETTKFVIVTGASQGIGLAITQRLLAEGLHVIAASRNPERMRPLIPAAYLDRLYTFATDLATAEGCASLANYAKTLTNAPHILVNNAGVFEPGSVLDAPAGQLEHQFAINVLSAYYVTAALVPAMRASGSGHIFNMCSVASIMAYDGGGSYTISKFALLGYTKALRKELLGSGIKVTAVLPGAVKTPSWDGVAIPEGRIMPPADIASMIWACYATSPSTVIEELILRPEQGDL
jgi:NAD(P)-dependent dehydrogenase (short-subunit alcohol dehydrogenase family)